MTLRFYPGGPGAVASEWWWETPYEVDGCVVAADAGAEIPDSAYSPDLKYAQEPGPHGSRHGHSSTAILPIEEGEFGPCGCSPRQYEHWKCDGCGQDFLHLRAYGKHRCEG